MAEPFAQPLTKLGDAGIGVSAAPSGGMGLALDPTGKVPFSANSFTPALLLCSSSLTLTTADQDVPGCSVLLGAGTYIVVGVFDFIHSVNGAGVAVGKLNVGGSLQTNQALLQNTGSANGDRATVSQVWVFAIQESFTAKLQATKTINAGTAQAVLTNTSMTWARFA